MIRSYDAAKKLAEVEVKNRFDLHDLVKVITPDREFSFTIDTILDPK